MTKKPLLFILLLTLALTGCQQQTEQNLQLGSGQQANEEQAQAHNPHDLQSLAKELDAGQDLNLPYAQPIKTKDGKIKIDWSYLDTKVTKKDPDHYPYPFQQDSQPVQNYAQAYQINAKQAQYAMMLSMASPEALGKVLDQISDYYLGHEFIDGADPALVIYTKPAVVSDDYEYVFADKFGEGLTLPIKIRPKQ